MESGVGFCTNWGTPSVFFPRRCGAPPLHRFSLSLSPLFPIFLSHTTHRYAPEEGPTPTTGAPITAPLYLRRSFTTGWLPR